MKYAILGSCPSPGTVYQLAFALNHGIFSVCHRRPCNHLYYAVCSDTFRRERIKRPVCKDSLWTITRAAEKESERGREEERESDDTLALP